MQDNNLRPCPLLDRRERRACGHTFQISAVGKGRGTEDLGLDCPDRATRFSLWGWLDHLVVC